MEENNANQKKAVIYCRVSTKEQVEEGNSLTTQERLCKEYAVRNNYSVAVTFIELGESAKTTNRTELKKMMNYCTIKKNAVDAVIVYRIDRLSRNIDDYSQIRLNLRRFNIEIKSISEHLEDTPSGRFMENIIANVAQFDNEVRAERSLNGMKEAVREGRYVWVAPLGYSNVKINNKSSIEPNEKAPLIFKIFELLAEGTHTIESTRKEILKLGLHTKHNKLSKSNFNTLIRNELYIGWIKKFGERTKGNFTSIVPEELFYKVQRKINNQRIVRAYTKTHPDFPLRQVCINEFGTRLSGGISTGNKGVKYYYYFFKRDLQYFKKVDLEELFVEFFNNYKFKSDQLKKLRYFLLHTLRIVTERLNENIKKLTKELDDTRLTQQVLVNKFTENIISDELFSTQIKIISEKEIELKNKIKKSPQYEVNFEHLYYEIREFLIAPGSFWKKVNLNMKMKIFCFNFPLGLQFDKKKIRTGQTPLFNKAISPLLLSKSFNVDHRFLNKNHPDIANTEDGENTVATYDYFTDEELRQIERYLTNLLELGNIVRYPSKESI